MGGTSAEEDSVDDGRRSVLKYISGLSGMLGAGALAENWGSSSVHLNQETLAERWKQARERGKDAVARFFGETDGAAFEIYRELFGEEVPADSGLDEFSDVSGDPQDRITPDDPLVEEYRDALDTDSIDGEQGRFVFDGDVDLPEYRTDDELFGKPYMQKGGGYFRRGAGDCDDYAAGMASVLEGAGYDTRTVFGSVDQAGNGDWGLHWALEFTDDDTVDDYIYVTDTIDPWRYAARSTYDGEVVGDWEPLTMFGADTPSKVYDPQWAAS